MKICKKCDIISYLLLFLNLLSKTTQYTVHNVCGSEAYSIHRAREGVPCYFEEETDDLPELEEDDVPNKAIFFIETSCRGGLNVREACSVEAAAKVNPKRQVYVLFAGAVNLQCVLSEPLASLSSYKNINLRRIYPGTFATDTGLEHLLRNTAVDRVQYPAFYALDLLKFIALYKLGGVYMSLDMMATRPFEHLPNTENWVGISDHHREILSADIISASADSCGRRLAETLISVMKDYQVWDKGGFNVMKKALERVCGAIPYQSTRKGYSFTCHGLVIYANKFFEPVPCDSSKDYFSSELNIDHLTYSFTQHLCNRETFDSPILKNSTYANLMRQFCPKIYNYFDRIGSEEELEFIENFNDLEPDRRVLRTKNSWKSVPNNVTTTKQSSKHRWYNEVMPQKRKVIYGLHARKTLISTS